MLSNFSSHVNVQYLWWFILCAHLTESQSPRYLVQRYPDWVCEGGLEGDGLSEADCAPPCRWASPDQLKA